MRVLLLPVVIPLIYLDPFELQSIGQLPGLFFVPRLRVSLVLGLQDSDLTRRQATATLDMVLCRIFLSIAGA